jgi:hypothetical protein
MSLYSHEASGSISVAAQQYADAKTSIEAEAWVLETALGQRLLEEVAEVPAFTPENIARWRKLASPTSVGAAIQLAACRAKARAKFSRGERMWLDPVGLEQSTGEAVARHKAERFQSDLIVDLCAGIGGDSIALAGKAQVLAVDSDHGRCRRIAWNAEVYDVGERVMACRSRAESFPIPRGAWVHLDPDRRATGSGRAIRLCGYSPGIPFLRELVRRVPGGGIKLSPASDYATIFSGPEFEIELISLNGECKEATVWFGAATTCRRRATRLPESVSWTERDGRPAASDSVPVAPVSAYVYDPDPALLRAGLLDSFAAAHDLGRIADGVDYLTGARLVETPFLAAFHVEEVLPFDVKRLRKRVSQRGLGPLEIRLRGLSIPPEQVRSRLRPHGSLPATLILVGGQGRARAVVAQRIRNS